MSRYAKIIAKTGVVVDVQDHPIQLADEERGVFDVVQLSLEPLDGTHIGDIVEVHEDDSDLIPAFPMDFPDEGGPSRPMDDPTAVPEAYEGPPDEHDDDDDDDEGSGSGEDRAAKPDTAS